MLLAPLLPFHFTFLFTIEGPEKLGPFMSLFPSGNLKKSSYDFGMNISPPKYQSKFTLFSGSYLI